MTPPRTITDKDTFNCRRKKALAFLESVELVYDDTDPDFWDVVDTLYVHAGIAVSDSIRGKRNGSYERPQNHQDAIKLLSAINPERSGDLQFLLNIKTRAGYGHDPVNHGNLTKAQRTTRLLVEVIAP